MLKRLAVLCILGLAAFPPPLPAQEGSLLSVLRSTAVPLVEPDILWRGGTQLEIEWSDMPVTVQGGSEDFVFTRRSVVPLPAPMFVDRVDSFAAYDRGDTLESVVVVYDQDNRVLHRRSPHKESGFAGLYRPFEQQWYRGPPVTEFTIDLACRVTAPNAVSDSLSARCHFLVNVLFTTNAPDPGPTPTPDPNPTPTPDPTCSIAHADDPGWNSPVSRPLRTRHQLEESKAIVGDRCGTDPNETLALLAQAALGLGYCASGPWDDEVAFLADDGLTEGYHAVSFGNGCYTGNPERDAWSHDEVGPPPGECGAPTPPPLHHFNLKPGTPWHSATPLVGADPAYCAAVGFTDGRAICSVRPDCSGPSCEFKDREACETLVVGGDPLWRTDGRLIVKGDNPYLARCCLPENTGGNCSGAPVCTYLEVCNTAGAQCVRAPI